MQKEWPTSLQRTQLTAIMDQYNEKHHCYPKDSYKKLAVKRLVAENVFSFLLQYAGLSFSTLLPHFTLAWLASGTAIAFVFIRGLSILPGIGLGSYIAFYLVTHHAIFSLNASIILLGQTYLIYKACLHYQQPSLLNLYLPRGLRLIFIISSVTGMMSFLLALSANKLYLWLPFWLANLNGLIIFSLTLATLDTYFPEFDKLTPSYLSRLAALACLCFLLSLLIAVLPPSALTAVTGLCLLVISLYSSYKLGWIGGIFILFVSALVLNIAAYLDAPFFSPHIPTYSFLLLQFFFYLAASSSYLLTIYNKRLFY